MKKVLVVDDSPEIRQLISMTLDPDEYDVSEASNADEALESCMQWMPDLVIMDVRMPGNIDGIQAMTAIKKADRSRHIHVLMLSGAGKKEYIDAAMKNGAIGYLRKPFSPLELIGKVESALGIN